MPTTRKFGLYPLTNTCAYKLASAFNIAFERVLKKPSQDLNKHEALTTLLLWKHNFSMSTLSTRKLMEFLFCLFLHKAT